MSEELTTLPRKKNTVTIPSQTKPRAQINGLNTGHGKWSAELKIATWNTTSLFRTGACQNLVETLEAYDIDTAALRDKMDWNRTNESRKLYSIHFRISR